MPYVLPTPDPRYTGWDYAGQGVNKGVDFLLQALLSGQAGIRQGQGRPPGVSGPVNATGQFYSQPQPPRPMGRGLLQWQPDLTRQATQADIAYKQAQTQSLTPEFQADLIRRYQGLLPGGLRQATSSIYQVGDILERKGKRAKITGFDPDGTPLVEPF